ncbi:hypothetical protein [Micromonospora parathelypteridis]|uniref:WD40 repeat domain-containing protein n=1 Tax=Micromonospora parathelypteridis TaxID=1839617 RepID=A0A840VWQ5_9ACTN|nr:hypothetical protein [Micromonospora parathelypteridis]MBB5478334.1 hypothetical protein [Micromonospora parathelypteridis]GGO06782.1 hypothetical protein GCM10011576_10770 [Micromonospora parathelypteridis]
MNEQDLRQLLTVSVEDVLPSQPATAGWERARRTRRTRRAVGAVALAVALVGGGTVAALRPPANPPPEIPVAPTRTAVPTHAAPVQRPPAELTFPPDPLARLSGPATVRLSERPVERALALFQPLDEELHANGPIRVLGNDGVVRSLDVVTLAPTRDAGGNQAAAVKPGVLSPDGRSAAFAQTNELIMVDLTTAGVRRIPLDGYLELVVWANDRVLVGGDDRTYAVDRVTGAASTIDVSAWVVAAPDPAAGREAALIEMVGERSGLKLRSRTAREGTTRSEQPITSSALPSPYQINEFYGRGWLHGGRVASAAWITSGEIDGAEGVAVLDARTGAVAHVLDLGRDRSKGCCPVLGWDNKGAVLLQLAPAAVARWDPETGEITGVVRDLRGMVALAG